MPLKYIRPVTGVRNDMRIAREEIFGPVLCVITYETVDEAPVVIANDAPRDVTAPFGGYGESSIGREGGR